MLSRVRWGLRVRRESDIYWKRSEEFPEKETATRGPSVVQAAIAPVTKGEPAVRRAAVAPARPQAAPRLALMDELRLRNERTKKRTFAANGARVTEVCLFLVAHAEPASVREVLAAHSKLLALVDEVALLDTLCRADAADGAALLERARETWARLCCAHARCAQLDAQCCAFRAACEAVRCKSGLDAVVTTGALREALAVFAAATDCCAAEPAYLAEHHCAARDALAALSGCTAVTCSLLPSRG